MTVLVNGTPVVHILGSFYLVLYVLQTFLQMFKASEPVWRHLLRFRYGDITPSACWWYIDWGLFIALLF
ncbi:UNVERIFIED_CONTAM: hypothetical protein Sradi_0688200 [Sesamum radiatum]|uniref:Uncharacterized protein n=1 Tax=Sesamum radiatum TaxID=300843 RepID=A0AAW2VRA2_SESRA